MSTLLDGTKGYKVRNTKEVQEAVIERFLTFNLTEDDFSDKGKEAGKVAGDLEKLTDEFDSVKKGWKAKIEDKETDLNQILSTIRERKEDRKVRCIEQKDFENHVVRYIFNGEVMHERVMELSERQMVLVKPGKGEDGKDERKAN